MAEMSQIENKVLEISKEIDERLLLLFNIVRVQEARITGLAREES